MVNSTIYSQKNTEDIVWLKSQEKQIIQELAPKGAYNWFSAVKMYGSWEQNKNIESEQNFTGSQSWTMGSRHQKNMLRSK